MLPRLVPALALVAGLAAADGERIPLISVPFDGGTHHAFCRIENGQGSIRFANASGMLRLRVEQSRLRLDRNGDGEIDDRDGPAIAPHGEIAEVTVRRGEGEGTVGVRAMHISNEIVVLQPATVLQGTLGGTTVRLIDGDLDGRLGGAEDVIALGDAEPVPWSALVAIDGGLRRLAVSADARELVSTPYAGPLASIRLELAPARPGPSVAECALTLVHESGDFACRLAAGGSTLAPPGAYTITEATLTVASPGGRPLFTLYDREPARLTVAEGPEGVTLRRGLPNRLAFDACLDASGAASVSAVRLEDGLGGRWQASVNDSQMQVLLRAEGRDRPVAKLEYG